MFQLENKFLLFTKLSSAFDIQVKPRLHEQFLCDKFYLLASLHEQFLFENKRLETGIYRWRQKNYQFYVLSRLNGQFSVCDNFYFPHKN